MQKKDYKSQPEQHLIFPPTKVCNTTSMTMALSVICVFFVQPLHSHTHLHTAKIHRCIGDLELRWGQAQLLLELTTALITITIKFCGLITHIALPARTKVIFSTLTSMWLVLHSHSSLARLKWVARNILKWKQCVKTNCEPNLLSISSFARF